MTLPVIDTHAHLITGNTDRYPPAPMHGTLRAVDVADPFDADMLIAAMDAASVTQACAVQRGHIYGYVNDYVIDSARRFAPRLKPVVMLDAAAPTAASTLRAMAAARQLGGIRLAAARITGTDSVWLDGPEAMRLWEVAAELGLPVAVIMFVHHRARNLPALARIADRHPNLPIVVDHVGVPHGSNYEVAWTHQQGMPSPDLGAPHYGIDAPLRDLCRRNNVHLKLTGITFERLRDAGVDAPAFVAALVATVGAERLMWGSDIGQTAGPYGRLVEEVRDAVAGLSPDDQRRVLSGTAAAVYGW